jgi:hypothetical protein
MVNKAAWQFSHVYAGFYRDCSKGIKPIQTQNPSKHVISGWLVIKIK